MKMTFAERQDKLTAISSKVRSVVLSCVTHEQLNASLKWGGTVLHNWTEHLCKGLGSFHCLYLYGMRDAMIDSLAEIKAQKAIAE